MVYFSSHLLVGLTANTKLFIIFMFFPLPQKKSTMKCLVLVVFFLAGFLWQMMRFMYLWSVLRRRRQFKGMSLVLGIWSVLSHL